MPELLTGIEHGRISRSTGNGRPVAAVFCSDPLRGRNARSGCPRSRPQPGAAGRRARSCRPRRGCQPARLVARGGCGETPAQSIQAALRQSGSRGRPDQSTACGHSRAGQGQELTTCSICPATSPRKRLLTTPDPRESGIMPFPSATLQCTGLRSGRSDPARCGPYS